MKKLKYCLLLLLASPLSIFCQNYELDEDVSKTIHWKGYAEVGGFIQEGTIEIESSTLTITDEGKLNGEIIIMMKSIEHDDKDLSKHLKNEDFFDVKKYPFSTIRFIQKEDKSISAELEIKGVKGQLTFNPHVVIENNTVKVKGSASIDRTQYGIKYNSSSYFQDLGSYAIKNFFDIAFDLEYKQAQ